MIGTRITENTSASKMKVFVIYVLCSLVGYAVGGSLSWPGALAVKTVIPGATKTTGYSTTQYINALPASYSFGVQPQFAYQVPHVNSFAPLSTGYYTISRPSFIPATNFIYPAQQSFIPILQSPSLTGGHIIPALPSVPSSPSPSPSYPVRPVETQSESAGDSDSTVVDSAEFVAQQQNQQLQPSFSPSSQTQPSRPTQSGNLQLPSTFPNFPTTSQISQAQAPFPSLPQISQIPQGQFPLYPSQFLQISQKPEQAPSGLPSNPQGSQLTSFPAIPQVPQYPIYPQFPQMTQSPQSPVQAPSLAQYPQFPQQPSLPQGPSPSPPTSFPSAINNDSGLNDEDTISVDSA